MLWHILNWMFGATLALAWFSRIVESAIGMPSVADISLPDWDRPLTAAEAPRVSIVVPARNEQESIASTLRQLMALDYPNYEVIAVNDRSTDRTGEIMDQVAAECGECGADALVRAAVPQPPAGSKSRVRAPVLKVINVVELSSNWLGKTHAMWSASQQATGDWLLFTDADVLFKPDSLRRAIAYAESARADHVVLFPRMLMRSVGEKMMIAFFQALFVFGHRPWKVADPKARDHMGVGAFNLVRRSAYDAVGTYKALRMEVVDDMKLGKVIKNAGFAQRNVFGADLISLRWAKGAFGVVDNLTKNFFAVLSFQWLRTVACIFGLGFLNLGPFLGVWLVRGWPRLPYAIALASILLIYHGMSRRSAIPPYYFLLHPVSTGLFMYTLLRSMTHTLWNDGIVWRGTRYPLDELRKGMV